MFFCKKKVKLSLIINDERWNSYFKDIQSLADSVVYKCFKVLKFPILKGSEICLVLTNDEEIKILNSKYRKKDKATNVLSFETGDKFLLGDIVISLDTLLKEATEQNIPLQNHFIHLLCHGVLHLLGFDHITDEQAEIMEGMEIKILKRFKIENPYE